MGQKSIDIKLKELDLSTKERYEQYIQLYEKGLITARWLMEKMGIPEDHDKQEEHHLDDFVGE